MLKKELNKFIIEMNESTRTKIIRAALADDVPFEAIYFEYKLTENEVVSLMKKNLPIKKFIEWRKRARGSGLKNLKQTRIKKEILKKEESDIN